MDSGHPIIVIGASAGGVDALSRVAHGLPADLPAAVFVVLHVAADQTSSLAAILTRHGRLPAHEATDGEAIVSGRIFVAAPDHHLVVERGRVALTTGPAENWVRPAVDVLFRSAAIAYPGRAIGVILSGHLSDGAAGLAAIKDSGGIAVVQDPDEAQADGMPRAALDATDVDHVAAVDDIGALLGRLVARPAGALPSDRATE